MNREPPQNPAGPFTPTEHVGLEVRNRCIATMAAFPKDLRHAVAGLSDAQLDTNYRNWTIRQIVHHVADSHINSYVRFKWALTENVPTIKAYDEGLWSALPESQTGDLQPSLQLIDGLHSRWCQLMNCLTDDDFNRTFHHPESDEIVSLNSALEYYAWHGKHHAGQILWVRENHDF